MIDDMLGPKKSEPTKPVAAKISVERSEEEKESVQAPYVEPAEPEDISEEINQKEVPKKVKKPKKHLHIWPLSWSRKKKRLFTGLLVVALLALIGGGVYWYHQNHLPKPAVAVTKATVVVAQPTTVASPLTGVQVTPDQAKRAVTGVMIENSPDARPQSGLNQAGVVYEAVAEGGITRFLALFQESNPSYVGPIRSSRPYYLDWLLPFDAAYAHVGGSPEALQQIKALHVKDLDQFANGSSYNRVSSRYAPHNVYTSIDRLYSLAQSKGYTTSTFTGFVRKPKENPVAVSDAKNIDFSISAALYNPHYEYDAASNSYKRSEGGKPHIDEKSGAQLSPKVVIALVTPSALESDGTHNSYATTGSGPMYVFQDGTVTQGTWKKDSRTAQFVFTNSSGQPYQLNAGQTWISLVTSVGAIAYKP
jgi:hypothetical protein